MSIIIKLFDDPTPNGFINKRLIQYLFSLTKYTDLTDDEKDKLFELLLLIGKKLVLIWSHYQNYIRIEEDEINKATTNPIRKSQGAIPINPSQGLFFEFDEFLVQIKSCLDYLVNVPIVIVGRNSWPLRTFGNKGEDVIKALANNIPQKYSSYARLLSDSIKKAQPWLELTIEARDKINHFLEGGINFEYFTITFTKDDKDEHLQVPMWSNDQTIKQFFDISWANIFQFCENFIGMLIAFRIQDDYSFYHGTSTINSIESPWKVTTHQEMERIVGNPDWKRIQ